MAEGQEISTPEHVEELYRPLQNVPFKGTYNGTFQKYEKVWQIIKVDPDSEFARLLDGVNESGAEGKIWMGFLTPDYFEDYRLYVEMGADDIVEGEQYTFTITRVKTFPINRAINYSAKLGAAMIVSTVPRVLE